MRKAAVVCAVMFFSVLFARAASPSAINGHVLDSSGAAIPGADITLTSVATGVTTHVSTAADGSYAISGLANGSYTLVVVKDGFAAAKPTTLMIQPGQIITSDIAMSVSSASESVVVHGDVVSGATPAPTQQQIFNSDQTIRVIDRKQMDIAGPVAGAAQLIATTPGANVTGYGNTGATKYTVSLNGINQGWGGYGGFTGGGSLGVTFDGVPIVDPATGLWQSPSIPETQMIQNLNVTYGPGDPAERWYTNIGGAVEFTPIQPTAKPHADLFLTYGSYNQKDLTLNAASGLYHGWSSVLSFGAGSGDDFRVSPDGFTNPSKDWALLVKTVKNFQDNSFEFGGYYAHAGGYRSQVILTDPNPAVTVDGQPGSLQYSQKTSGYYSTLPYNSYNKYDTNDMALIYGRQNIKLDDTMSLQNLAWFMRIDRTHYRINDVYGGGPQLREWNNPHTDTVGDRLFFTKRLPMNTITGGGYYIHSLYNSRNNFYNPADGGSKRVVNAGGKIRSTYFNQDDFAVSLQDDVHPISWLHVTPGIRFVGFQTNFADHAAQDFTLGPGAVLSTVCRYIPNVGEKNTATNQGACPAAQENRTGIEPSANATITARPWLTIYGGYLEALKAPQVGGGGGLFQSVDPSSYHLARQRYYQAGFKTHAEGTGLLNSFILGAEYFHQNYANQEIDIGLANGNTISTNGTSSYHGVNAFVDDDPVTNLHLFANASLERATYTYYVIAYNPNGTPGASYNGSAVPYVPASTVNIGAYYNFKPTDNLTIQPTASFQFIGRQHIFDNSLGAPSPLTMASYETLNMGAKAPFHHFDLNVMALNVLNKQYNEYEYISSGGYFGTPTGGYALAYPAAPFTIYGGATFHF
ncbi:MAG: TonB-dependent receptor [Acidobacteria bacterium]|nr:TonB-dependent receptor [Acidobacteriota bacterium]MBW4045588.1 TonB-dependent receptor [Acidobacteriota bacterium]